MHAAWHWFVHNGGERAVLYVTVSVLLGTAVRKLLQELRRIADLLSTHTPGGLRDVVNALKRLDGGRDRPPGKP